MWSNELFVTDTQISTALNTLDNCALACVQVFHSSNNDNNNNNDNGNQSDIDKNNHLNRGWAHGQQMDQRQTLKWPEASEELGETETEVSITIHKLIDLTQIRFVFRFVILH